MDKNKQLKQRYKETSAAKQQVVNKDTSKLKTEHELEIESLHCEFIKSNHERDKEIEVQKNQITQLNPTLFKSNRNSN